ncbi:MAG: sterol desaturase family protein [Moorea sp. SIO3I7]|uniref:sterol desaturase family protein n=1 Tax=unclassified Moorena TaxID=2683338 RepID=UPI0013C08F5F|nr:MULTISPECIES: sterol desaturase family protein [unclassified Moorena]NEN94393.1 sterol desaturase family protein [Moorena sp. SIO3I7]NEO06709.1 sterol desaturase family protein [Moorena sp. SIO3I8]NEO20280.1 sterol desaturase family protein [Moorena sp. SIO4A5]NEQ60218.1 sterol desaturase family protein [Moorena sp. SIO4A1]
MLDLLQSSRIQFLWRGCQNVAGITLRLVVICFLVQTAIAWSDLAYIRTLAEEILITLSHEISLNPWFYGIVSMILLIEIWLPARQQARLSVGFCQDSLWLLGDLVETILFLKPCISVLYALSNRVGFPIFDSATILPPPIMLVLGFLLSDFLIWFGHILRHHIPAFWYFHAVHHSQTELNLLSGLRFHIVDKAIAYIIVALPMIALGISAPSIILFKVLQKWYLRIYHANLKLNYGWLKHIMITPQSHRIHHSIEAQHRDRNFGSILIIWDYLFGTQYCQYDEYPATGIDDPNFPLESSRQPHHLLINFIHQNLYPFQQLSKFSINHDRFTGWFKNLFVIQPQK